MANTFHFFLEQEGAGQEASGWGSEKRRAPVVSLLCVLRTDAWFYNMCALHYVSICPSGLVPACAV